MYKSKPRNETRRDSIDVNRGSLRATADRKVAYDNDMLCHLVIFRSNRIYKHVGMYYGHDSSFDMLVLWNFSSGKNDLCPRNFERADVVMSGDELVLRIHTHLWTI